MGPSYANHAEEKPSCRDQIPAAHAAAANLSWYGSSDTQFSEARAGFCSPAQRWHFLRQRPRSGARTRAGALLHTWYRISGTYGDFLPTTQVWCDVQSTIR